MTEAERLAAGITTVVVVNFNGAHLLPDCLNSLRGQTHRHHVIVVDNASTDASLELLARDFPELQVIAASKNTGFAGGAQLGLDAARSEFVALLNNDAQAEPTWLQHLVDALVEHRDAAAVTSKLLLSASGLINNVGGIVDRLGVGSDRGLGQPNDGRYDTPVEVFAFCGGAALLRREAALHVGGFATQFFLYYEDTDLSWRLRRAGFSIRYVPGAVVHHLHSATTDQASDLFAFHNLRNHLLMLIRNAPLRVLLLAAGRFLLVTAADAVRQARGRQPAVAQHRLGLRGRVIADVARHLRPEWAERRRLQRQAVQGRRSVARAWLGRLD